MSGPQRAGYDSNMFLLGHDLLQETRSRRHDCLPWDLRRFAGQLTELLVEPRASLAPPHRLTRLLADPARVSVAAYPSRASPCLFPSEKRPGQPWGPEAVPSHYLYAGASVS